LIAGQRRTLHCGLWTLQPAIILSGLVLLARDPAHRRARLEPVSRAEILRELILQDFADAVPATEKLDRLIAVVEGARCFRLSYATASSAADVLRREFGADHSSELGVSHVHVGL